MKILRLEAKQMSRLCCNQRAWIYHKNWHQSALIKTETKIIHPDLEAAFQSITAQSPSNSTENQQSCTAEEKLEKWAIQDTKRTNMQSDTTVNRG